ncbi:hypothetical protein, partial [Corynebacterium coyleae]|uniref:hypothetical protein n=1 Tax=Corynebacterium coyleae TaxID=53374 RepID=UPI00254AFF8F
EDPYHLSGKPLPTTRIAPTNYTETALRLLQPSVMVPERVSGIINRASNSHVGCGEKLNEIKIEI